ncbi:site-2 protease family protein [Streptomyces sp. NPDC048297]|uniref:site-2 protease family protein n=1 Tax=Streptomyces sp. NPDC048297 TaxID=3365531 RepID=UPI00371D398D
MDVSGGSGRPRSGNDEPTDQPAGAPTPTTDPAADTAQERGTAGPAPKDEAESVVTSPQPKAQGDNDAPSTEPITAVGSDAPNPEPTSPKATPAGNPQPAHDQDPAADPSEPAKAARPENPRDPEDPESPENSENSENPENSVSPEGTPARDGRVGNETSATGRDDERAPGALAAGAQRRTPAHSGIARQEPPQPRPKEPGGGILMGRPFGVPVYVAPSWFLVAALITWVFGGQLDRVLPELGAARYLVSLFFAVAFYASVLVHELAHTVAAIRFKLPVRRIQLQFFGGVSEIEKEAETPGREFVLAFVGPLLSLVLAGVFYLALKPVTPDSVPGVLLAGLMISNLIVAVFNLLPGLPLDGGRMLRAVVWKITGRPMSGTVAAAWVGRALALCVLVGLPLLNQSDAFGGGTDLRGMDTVTDALLAAILAAIIWTGAGNSLRMARLREHLPELRARTLTRRAVPVETDTPLSEALRRANAAGARALVVVDAHGNPLSLVREAAIVGVPEHRRPWVPVSGLAQDLTDGMRVSAELAGEELLDTLRATPATEYLVVEESGEIYGVLSAADVERAFVKAMARPS